MRATSEVWNWALTVLVELLLEEEEEEEDTNDWSLEADGRLDSAFYRLTNSSEVQHILILISLSLTILGPDPPRNGGGLPSLFPDGPIFLNSFFFLSRLAMEGCLLLLWEAPSVMSCDSSYDLWPPSIVCLCLACSRGNGSGEVVRWPGTMMVGALEISGEPILKVALKGTRVHKAQWTVY